MKVVLAAIHPYPSPQAVPLANAFLAAALKNDEELSANISITLCDLFVRQPVADCVAAILSTNPDAVGFSIYLWNRRICLAISALLRRERQGLTIFAGGPEATADPAGLLADTGADLDFLILGEGEATFLDVLARLYAGDTVAGIKGTSQLTGGEIVSLPRPPLALLDTIPSPYLSGILDPAAHSGALWQLARGCDFACDFCFDTQGTKGVRRFGMERVGKELEWFVSRKVSQVFVLDSTFNQDMRRAKAIIRLIARIAPHIHFHFEARSEFIDREMARLFADINCSLQIGLQSADPEALKRVRRLFNPTEFTGKIALLNENGVVFGFDLIYGLPGDTLEGFRSSLDYALGLYPNHLDIFPLAVLPGTRLAATASALGLRRLPDPPYTLESSPTFSAADMKEAAGLACACDIFYSRGKAVAWFNGVVKAIAMPPSSLLAEFQRWLAARGVAHEDESKFDDNEIWEMQRAFLRHLFTGKKLRKLLPVALDLVDYHYHYAAALLATVPDIPTDRELEQADLLSLPLTLAPSTRLAQFNYEIFDLLESGEVDLREFAACFTPNGSCAAIYPKAEEVFSESLITPYFQLLERLDGATPAGKVAAALRIPPDETRSFLEFTTAEGITLLPGA